MAVWKFAVGNLVSRAARFPVPVSPALEDPLERLSKWGNGYPDERGGFQWRADGTYSADIDTNFLASFSEAAHKPTGWADLLLYLAGTPGLSANPPDWATYGGRAALRFFRPVFQDVDVMPGESVKITGGIYRPSGAAGSTGVEVRVIDLTTGHQYDAGAVGFDDDGKVAEQTTADTWLDFSVTIAADTSDTERRTYRVVFSPQAASFGATTFAYLSANGGGGSPALYGQADTFAFLGHGLPVGATVSFVPQPSGTTVPLPLMQPSCYIVAPGGSQLVQTWRVSIAIPSALRPSAPRPIIGEIWIGRQVALERSPTMDGLGYTEGDPSQIRVKAARNRQEILSDDGPPAASLKLNFKVPVADYVRIRDGLTRLTRFGKEPVLLIPSVAWEGGRFYHGRVGDEIAYGRFTPAESAEEWRSFTLAFDESPFAA